MESCVFFGIIGFNCISCQMLDLNLKRNLSLENPENQCNQFVFILLNVLSNDVHRKINPAAGIK